MAPDVSTGSIWDKQNLALTLGSVLAVTLVAFQGLAVATIAPVVADDLDGRSLYGWIFNAFLLPQIVATVIAGREVGRRQPALVFYISMAIFGIGSLVAGAAPDIWTLFLGRGLQGIGAGASFATIYAIVGGAYDDRLRPAMLAALSSAFIVPALIGPVIAGFIADQFSWRYVFWSLIPIMFIVTPLTWPSYRKVRLETAPDSAATSRRVPWAVVLGIGTGLFLAGPDIRPVWLAAVVTLAGLVLLTPMLRRLLPEGTFTARPVVGGAIASRALAFGGFMVTETYMVFALNEVGGVSTAVAGIVLTVGSLTWTAGSILQARLDRHDGPAGRASRVKAGTVLMLVGVGVILGTVVIYQDIWVTVAAGGWLIAGLGIGLTHTTSTALAFAHAPQGQEGMVASSTLLGDLFASSIGVGVGGVLLALTTSMGWSTAASAGIALAFGWGILVLALLAAMRMKRGLAGVATM